MVMVFSLFAFVNTTRSQNFAWAQSFGDTLGDSGMMIVTDAAGNVYTTGWFEGNVDFDPGPGTAILSALGGNQSMFVTKMTASGSLVWARCTQGGTSVGNSIDVDANGNVYTTGLYGPTVDFDPGAGVFNLTSAGGWSTFISKLDMNGNLVWAKSVGASANLSFGFGVRADASGNVYAAGNFQSAADFDPGAGTMMLTPMGVTDAFVVKLNPSGNFVWAKQFGGSGDVQMNSIHIDVSGNVYTTGGFRSTVDFDPGAATFNLTSAAAGFNSTFISKLDANGNFVWAKMLGGTSTNYHCMGFDIKTDVSGNVYTVGQFGDNIDMDPGAGVTNFISVSMDSYISKLDASGNFVWGKQIGGLNADIIYGIDLDAANNIYLTGSFASAACDFDPGAGVFTMNEANGHVFFEVLDASGNFVWVAQAGGGTYDVGHSITVDGSGNIYATGSYAGTGDFDPGTGVFNLTPSSNVDEIFIMKLLPLFTQVYTLNRSNNSIEVYPNPANEKLFIRNISNDVNRLILFDINGKEILQMEITGDSDINTSTLKAGIYSLNLETSEGVIKKKIAIIK